MPSFQDSAVIFFIALLLFGPKKLPELARQLGKLMGEFRRASNEFRMQMEDELRLAEQEERQKKLDEMKAAAPVTPEIPETSAVPEVLEHTIAPPIETTDSFVADQNHEFKSEPVGETEPLPIASSGELDLMPPSTGLPVANTSVSHAFDSIPRRSSSNSEVEDSATTEAPVHG